MKVRDTQFQQLISDYGPGIARVAGTYTRTREERDDLLQEIWLAVWRALPGFRGEASVKTFIFRIAHNRSVTELARRRPDHDDALLEGVVDNAPGPAEHLAGQRQSEQLRLAVQALPLGLRQVFSLRLEGLSYSEVAEVLGISESNVAVRLNRARQRLSKRLGEHSER